MDHLWDARTDYKEKITESELQGMKKALLNSTFQFYPMYRSWIPKPNKPGEMRPITQPNKVDVIVMEAISQVLSTTFEEIFLHYSHGFRKGRGIITFFSEVNSWNLSVDRLIKSDLVKCFDNVDHELLITVLQSYVGDENSSFCDLILTFLQTNIKDRKGNDYSNRKKGIPQGSPLSPS